jgi:ABC-type multidrug transport system permease subunit
VSAILAIAGKDLRLLARDRGALFWAIVFPILFAVLFGAVFPSAKSPHAIPVAVSGASLDAPGLQATATDPEGARLRVRRGDAIAAVLVTEGGVEIVIDPTHAAEAAVVEAAVLRGMMANGPTIKRSFATSNLPPSGFELAFPAAVLWGLIGCAGAFATASVAERRSGTHLRLRAAPIPARSLLLGKVLACLVACATDATLLLIVARLAFGVRVERHVGLPLAIASCAVCFAGITILLGTLGRTEQGVGGAGWATLLLLAMVGGAMVPLSAMPPWLRATSDASPVKWGIVALEGATFRGLTVRELLPACAILLGMGALSLASAAAMSRRMSS